MAYKNNLAIVNSECVAEIKKKSMIWINEKFLDADLTYTKPGSASNLYFGRKPSEQSINIKLGRHGEYFTKIAVETNNNFELLMCGIQTINDKKKDVDLIFKHEIKKTIYYRELKGNMQLDTEKLPATISKCNEIENSLKTTYSDYKIDCGILNWTVYNRKGLSAGLSNIKRFETAGIKVDHMEDFLNIIDINWNEEDYYSHFREIGNKITIKFE
jgi:hypothetical protein